MTAAVATKPHTRTIDPFGTFEIALDQPLLEITQRTLPMFSNMVCSTITAYVSKLDTTSVINLFTHALGPKKVMNDKNHVSCEECEDEEDRLVPAGLKSIPETQEREAFCLIDLFYPNLDPFDFLDMLSGIDIVEREPDNVTVKIVCYDIIFHHELWFTSRIAKARFEKRTTTDVVDFLVQQKKYKPSPRPVRGNIVIYSHAHLAMHFAVIDTVDPKGNITVISKFGNDHVYRHALAQVPRYCGRDYVVLERSNPFPALYTSPAKIRAAECGGI